MIFSNYCNALKNLLFWARNYCSRVGITYSKDTGNTFIHLDNKASGKYEHVIINKEGSIISVNSEIALKVGEAYLSDIKKLASLNSYIGVLEIFVDNSQFTDCILFKDNKFLMVKKIRLSKKISSVCSFQVKCRNIL